MGERYPEARTDKLRPSTIDRSIEKGYLRGFLLCGGSFFLGVLSFWEFFLDHKPENHVSTTVVDLYGTGSCRFHFGSRFGTQLRKFHESASEPDSFCHTGADPLGHWDDHNGLRKSPCNHEIMRPWRRSLYPLSGRYAQESHLPRRIWKIGLAGHDRDRGPRAVRPLERHESALQHGCGRSDVAV